jgi:hypothetical protein
MPVSTAATTMPGFNTVNYCSKAGHSRRVPLTRATDGYPKSLENSNAAYDGTLTDRYTDKIKVRIDTIYHAGEHRSDDYARL